MPTDQQLKANRENAQLSTGPRTEAGKATSSMNAVKTGLTGRTVLSPGDDIALYREHLACVEDRHRPATDAENMLVESVAETEWRLARIPSLESGIYAIGRMEFQEQFLREEDEAVRRILTDAKVFLMYQRQLNNLSIQEARLRRQREKDLAELKRLQSERAAQPREMPGPFTSPSPIAPPAPQTIGFDFSSRLDHLRRPVYREFGPSTPPFRDPFSPDPSAEPSQTAIPDRQPESEAA